MPIFPPSLGATGQVSGAARIRAMFEAVGLGELSAEIDRLYASGITDFDTVAFYLTDTSTFQRILPGIIDPQTRQFRMTAEQYVSYSRRARELFAAHSLPDPSRAFIGGAIATGKRLEDLNEELEIYSFLRENPRPRRDFFLYTGIEASPEDLLAIVTGQAPNLEAAYNSAIQQGVAVDDYLSRVRAAENTFASAQTSLGALTPPVSNPDQRAGQLSSTISSLQGNIRVFSDQVASLQSALSEAQRQSTNPKLNAASRAIWANRVTILNKDLAIARNQLSNYQNQLSGAQRESQEINTFLGQRQAVQGQVDVASSQLGSLASQPPTPPVFAPAPAPVSRTEILRGFRQARAAEVARFSAGGGARVSARPRIDTF